MNVPVSSIPSTEIFFLIIAVATSWSVNEFARYRMFSFALLSSSRTRCLQGCDGHINASMSVPEMLTGGNRGGARECLRALYAVRYCLARMVELMMMTRSLFFVFVGLWDPVMIVVVVAQYLLWFVAYLLPLIPTPL